MKKFFSFLNAFTVFGIGVTCIVVHDSGFKHWYDFITFVGQLIITIPAYMFYEKYFNDMFGIK